jgi:ABC-type transport system involved in cytochrome bd biosynthesis fused ATPase/permease subunit
MSSLTRQSVNVAAGFRPTAALDEVTERALCETLAGLSRFTTVLAISHRPALAEFADQVVTLQDGRVQSVKQPALASVAAV